MTRLELHQHIDALSGPKSSRSADPNSASRAIRCRWQNALTVTRSMTRCGLVTVHHTAVDTHVPGC